MMAADYRHIGGRENRLGRHYSRFSPFLPTPALASQSLALQKLCDAGSNRRRRATLQAFEGCLFGITSGHCGLTGQLLVRISPADGIAEPDPCSLTERGG